MPWITQCREVIQISSDREVWLHSLTRFRFHRLPEVWEREQTLSIAASRFRSTRWQCRRCT